MHTLFLHQVSTDPLNSLVSELDRCTWPHQSCQLAKLTILEVDSCSKILVSAEKVITENLDHIRVDLIKAPVYKLWSATRMSPLPYISLLWESLVPGLTVEMH